MKTLLTQIANRSVPSPMKNKSKVSVAPDRAVVPVDKENVVNDNKVAGCRSQKDRFVKKQSDSKSAEVGQTLHKSATTGSNRASSDSATITKKEIDSKSAEVGQTLRVSLADICDEEKLSIPVLRYYAIQIALKLQALHNKGLIHGKLRLDDIVSKNSQLVLDDLHSECHVGDFFGSKLTSFSAMAAVPPEMVALLDTKQEKQYRTYWKPIMDDDISVRLTIGPNNAIRIEEAIKSLQCKKSGADVQVKSPLCPVRSDQSLAKQKDWKATVSTFLEGMIFEDLPTALSSASSSNDFAKQWRRMVGNSRRWKELEPRPSPDASKSYVAKSFNNFDGCDKSGSVLSELLPYELVEASPAIDVWGMGTILFEMVAGRPILDLADSNVYAIIKQWDTKTCEKSLASVEDSIVRDLLSCLLASDGDRPKNIQHVLQHAFFATGVDEAEQGQRDASPAIPNDGISLLKRQVVQEELDQNEEYSWYEQGRFPLCKTDGEGLAPEEQLKHIKSNNADLRNALQEQKTLMGQMSKTNYDLQNLLAHQVSKSAEKSAMLQSLQASLGKENDQYHQTSDELRLLKVQVADMEHAVLDKMEESDLLLSVDSSRDEVRKTGNEPALRVENDRLQQALCERNTLMEQMGRTNQDLQNALSQQVSLLMAKDDTIYDLRASLEGETERNSEACETIRILEAQAADMQENALSSMEEDQLRRAPSKTKEEVEMLQRLVEEQTVRLNEQKQFVEELEQAVKVREEKAEERKEEIVNLKEKLNKERAHCKKVIKAQGRIIDDLKKGLKTHKDHVKDNAARYQKQLKDVQTKKADLNVTLSLQTKFMNKMANMNKDLQKKMYEQELRLEAKDTKLRSLDYSLSSDDMSIRTASTTEASIAAEELRRDLVNMVNSRQQTINEKDETIGELYTMLEAKRNETQEMMRMKEEDGEHVKRALQEASLRYAEAVAQLKVEAEANQRANMTVVLASVPTVAICAVHAVRLWKLGC